MGKTAKICIAVLGGALILVMIGLILTGLYVGWGPFTFLQFDKQEKAILEKYPSNQRQGEIIFYGASNFRLWTQMENDLADFKVQNHGFGGSTDKDLVQRADKLLYSYNPRIVVFQTGSNDYVGLPGSDDEKVEACMAYKREMFSQFHERLPEAKFVIMSGLLLPGRSQYTELTQRINGELARLCEKTDYLYFADASAMTFNGETYSEELFIEDGIHLNHEGQLRWCREYIRPILEWMTEECELDYLRKEG
ncbi:MAG: GDSL-type esterase/lipase family protein [Faecousia sp.]